MRVNRRDSESVIVLPIAGFPAVATNFAHPDRLWYKRPQHMTTGISNMGDLSCWCTIRNTKILYDVHTSAEFDAENRVALRFAHTPTFLWGESDKSTHQERDGTVGSSI